MDSTNNIFSEEMGYSTKNLIFYSDQYLKQLKSELLYNDTLSDSEDQTYYELTEWNNEIEKSYKRLNDEYSKINGLQTENINQFSTPYDTLLAENIKLRCTLEDVENVVRNLQKELCIQKNDKSQLKNVLFEREKLCALQEVDLNRKRDEIKTCIQNYNRLNERYWQLETDMNSKPTNVDVKRLFVNDLQNTLEKEREAKRANESKYYASKRTDVCETGPCCPNELRFPTLSSEIEGEIRHLRETSEQLKMQNEREEMMANAYEMKHIEPEYRPPKTTKKSIKSPCKAPCGTAKCQVQSIPTRFDEDLNIFKPLREASSSCVAKPQVIPIASSTDSLNSCKPPREPPRYNATSIVENHATACRNAVHTCCKTDSAGYSSCYRNTAKAKNRPDVMCKTIKALPTDGPLNWNKLQKMFEVLKKLKRYVKMQSNIE